MYILIPMILAILVYLYECGKVSKAAPLIFTILIFAAITFMYLQTESLTAYVSDILWPVLQVVGLVVLIELIYRLFRKEAAE